MRYLGLLIISMIAPLIFVTACLYYLIFKIMAEQIGIPEYIAYNLFPVINKINLILLIGLPPLFLILILWGIVLSHRFAGPLERVEKELHRIVDHSEHHKRLKLRRHDDMEPIAGAINKLLDKLEGNKK